MNNNMALFFVLFVAGTGSIGLFGLWWTLGIATSICALAYVVQRLDAARKRI